jgi:hypothetical protein
LQILKGFGPSLSYGQTRQICYLRGFMKNSRRRKE